VTKLAHLVVRKYGGVEGYRCEKCYNTRPRVVKMGDSWLGWSEDARWVCLLCLSELMEEDKKDAAAE
jgi:hypothetical protein